MLLARDRHDRVLLECRPPTGVWGGLYSLPEFEDVDSLRVHAEQRLGLALRHLDKLERIQHTFTHFRLAIQPVAARAEQAASRIADNAGSRWVRNDELGTLGIPAPIRRLLLSHPEQR